MSETIPADLLYGAGGTPCCGMCAYIEPCPSCPATVTAAAIERQIQACTEDLARWRRSEYYTQDRASFLLSRYPEAVLAEAIQRLDAARL